MPAIRVNATATPIAHCLTLPSGQDVVVELAIVVDSLEKTHSDDELVPQISSTAVPIIKQTTANVPAEPHYPLNLVVQKL